MVKSRANICEKVELREIFIVTPNRCRVIERLDPAHNPDAEIDHHSPFRQIFLVAYAEQNEVQRIIVILKPGICLMSLVPGHIISDHNFLPH